MPAASVSQPARWPMTSARMIRWWLWAVLWSRSMASVAMVSEVANPIVASVSTTSLSMVLGSITMLSPALTSRRLFLAVPLPPMHTRASSRAAGRS